jgi:hypothetical protein
VKGFRKNRKASTYVYGIVLLTIVIVAFGIIFYNFVLSNIEFTQNTLNLQLASLLMKSVRVNSTHITTFLQNLGSKFVEITGAYVNGVIGSIHSVVKLEPGNIGSVTIMGTFLEGRTYVVKLLSALTTVISFEIDLQK